MLRIRVTGRVQVSTVPPVHEYLVETEVATENTFTSQHRFSDFVALHEELQTEVEGLPPTFPLQKLSLHLSASLDERTEHLQFYCQSLAALCAAACKPAPMRLMRFLGVMSDHAREDHEGVRHGEHGAVSEKEASALHVLQRSARLHRTRSFQASGGGVNSSWSMLGWLRSLNLHVLAAEALAPPAGSDVYSFVAADLTEAGVHARLEAKGLGALAGFVWAGVTAVV